MNGNTFPIEHDEIQALIPHAGTMCLLNQVISSNDSSIVCSSISQTYAANPLFRCGLLSARCGIEYAAQAMAVHGGLTAQALDRKNQPKNGYIVMLSNVDFYVETLQEYTNLYIYCERLMATDSGSKYSFKLASSLSVNIDDVKNILLEGSALVSLAD